MLADTDGIVEPEPAPEPGPEEGGGMPFGQTRKRKAPTSGSMEIDLGLAEEAVRRAAENLGTEGAREATRWIESSYDATFGADGEPTQQAQITVDESSDVPQFAQELLSDAVDGGAIHKPDALTDRQFRTMENVVQDSMTQSHGWSVDSISRRLAPAMPDIDAEERRRYTQNAVQNVVQAALELGYMIEGELDERRFYLGGAERANTCEACIQLLNRTNPNHGGEPVPLDEFRDLAVNAAEQHGISQEFVSGGQLHPSCIHRLTEHREARGAGS